MSQASISQFDLDILIQRIESLEADVVELKAGPSKKAPAPDATVIAILKLLKKHAGLKMSVGNVSENLDGHSYSQVQHRLTALADRGEILIHKVEGKVALFSHKPASTPAGSIYLPGMDANGKVKPSATVDKDFS